MGNIYRQRYWFYTAFLTLFRIVDKYIVEKDFTDSELRDFTIRKEIIFESKDKNDVSKKESEFILSLRSNDPAIGYNQTPRFIL